MSSNLDRETFANNVYRFFGSSNRSMMGGWTLAEVEEAKREAAELDGPAKEAAEKEIAQRIERERAAFGADFKLDQLAR